MKLTRRLWQIFGPLIVAAVAIVILMLLPMNYQPATSQTLDKAASSLSATVLKGEGIKDQAFKTSKYVPFIGSSELSRMDPFHPSVLAQKYNRAYTPFLLGASGTLSLTHFLSVQAMGKDLANKRAVVIISPQWFTARGANPNMFDFYYSPIQTCLFLENAKDTEADRFAAHRILQMPAGSSDAIMHRALLQVASGLPLSDFQRFYITNIKGKMLATQDNLFSRMFIRDRTGAIRKGLESLPSKYNYDELDDLAGQLGKGETTNNSFQIKNSFYDNGLSQVVKKLKHSQTKFNYEVSPEYSDFQLLLNEFSRQHMDVLFIIPPVNRHWTKYTGLPQSTLHAFDRKITYQLRSQGFNNIHDMTNEGGQPYFMEDTIHLGWRGWLDVDRAIRPFLKQTSAGPVKYHLNNHFYTAAWQKAKAKSVPDMRIEAIPYPAN